ncbi:MAG: vitamin K epoxide reductase family protein [Acidobacteriaceae bacterium]
MSLEPVGEKQPGNPVAPTNVCSVHKGMALACCCAAMATLAPVALVQLRIMEDLPDPPGRMFNSKRVVLSKDAYHLGIPDGVLGLASYGVTLALLVYARPGRPMVNRTLRAKLAFDATMAIRNVRKQITEHKRVCSWCIGAAIATAGLVYFARKERDAEQMRQVEA